MDIDKRKDKHSHHQNVRDTIMQLSELTDLIGLRTYIVNKTKYGRKAGPQPWTYTLEGMATYAPGSDASEVIRLFESVGCKNEIEAVRWLLKHDELVP